jgi:hypothetical protein
MQSILSWLIKVSIQGAYGVNEFKTVRLLRIIYPGSERRLESLKKMQQGVAFFPIVYYLIISYQNNVRWVQCPTFMGLVPEGSLLILRLPDVKPPC